MSRLKVIVSHCITSAVASACLLGPAASANTLDAPTVVMADKTGTFSYEAVFTVKDTVILSSWGVFPDGNARVNSFIADCFCEVPMCQFDPGEELVIPVVGSLVNPSENGSVRVYASLCPSGGHIVSTTVVPWEPEVSIETVPIGNPGNANDTDGFGGVDYVYNIGRFEVTAGEYTVFLNAVADDDTYGLYDTMMWTDDFGCKIERTGSSPNYSYSVASDWHNRPVNRLSWGDAARFANWLHNGQPTGAQNRTTTEDGSYDLTPSHEYWGPDGQIIDWNAFSDALAAVIREPNATWVIPSEDEWYKAAYHKNDGVTGNYYSYPTGSDSVPSNELVYPDPGNNANFHYIMYSIGGPYYRTVVGDFENSGSQYGTFDQGGNVREWNETITYPRFRGLRGGSYGHGARYLSAATRGAGGRPANEYNSVGFRVAEVPCDFDSDHDGDLDLYDHALFQAAYGGDVDSHYFACFHNALTGPR